ncbi:MAG: ATP-binding cassette domain-containing protein, partial [Blautia sp.]|nr:ATP-binding cassette domain-containing protein [Blautia sp.]
GYDTMVGERGVTLSGGQKQRVAIARMLIGHPRIMVFDDSLSAVDTQTDARIRAALREDTRDATVFLVSHRITTLQHADLILVMDKGRLAQAGTHAQLMEAGGIYRRVFELQTAG